MLGQANISPTEDGAEVMCCLGTILREQGDLAGALGTLSQKMASEYLPSVDTRVNASDVSRRCVGRRPAGAPASSGGPLRERPGMLQSRQRCEPLLIHV